MIRTILVYGLILGAGAFVLKWLEFGVLARTHPVEIYVGLIALAFMGLGVWVGARLFRKPVGAQAFEINTRAMASLGISDREFEVLELLAAGRSNKEISARLNVSPNTVKTHVANLYGKLEVRRRTEAVLRARELGMLP
ncbi:MAG TPA: response regulator transcription factor [Hyphomonadaceae bacterium]|nr:response regulator transcription factor [Hyphomonadaceae bacterium]